MWRSIIKVMFYIYIIGGILVCIGLISKGQFGVGVVGIALVIISGSGLGVFLEMADNIAKMENCLSKMSRNTEGILEKVTQTVDDSGQIKKAIFSMQNIKRE